MPIDMTPEEALKALERVRGPDGFNAVKTALRQSVENRKMTIAAMQGEINGLNAAGRMLEALEARLGFTEPQNTSSTGAAQSGPAPVAQTPDEPDPETVKRVQNGQCTFKDRRPPHGTGKWFERKLKTKEEQSTGFCQIHMDRLGMKSAETQKETNQ